jgi:hypothetical protein
MQTESPEYEIGLYPRGPNSCEWKIWPKAGGPAAAQGVARTKFDAERAAEKAIARLASKKA